MFAIAHNNQISHTFDALMDSSASAAHPQPVREKKNAVQCTVLHSTPHKYIL